MDWLKAGLQLTLDETVVRKLDARVRTDEVDADGRVLVEAPLLQ